MKILLFSLAIGLWASQAFAQTTQVKIGRHGNCSTGRGICGISYNPENRSLANNATFTKDANGNLLLRMHRSQFADGVLNRLFGQEISSVSKETNLEILEGFNLDLPTTIFLGNFANWSVERISARSFRAVVTPEHIDIYLKNTP